MHQAMAAIDLRYLGCSGTWNMGGQSPCDMAKNQQFSVKNPGMFIHTVDCGWNPMVPWIFAHRPWGDHQLEVFFVGKVTTKWGLLMGRAVSALQNEVATHPRLLQFEYLEIGNSPVKSAPASSPSIKDANPSLQGIQWLSMSHLRQSWRAGKSHIHRGLGLSG
jgi:hypothetical protein